jgi:hypothetical protein
MILSTAINPKGINSYANLQHEISAKNVAFGSSFPPNKSSKTTTTTNKQNTKSNTNPKSKTQRQDLSHKTNKQTNKK